MDFVLVHGWGFGPGIWRELRGKLPGNTHLYALNLGFIRDGPGDAGDWPEAPIAIGHSLGLLWLLHHKKQHDFRALVSIQGFDRFCPHIPQSRVERMRRELAADPAATMARFWRACAPNPLLRLSSWTLPGSTRGSAGCSTGTRPPPGRSRLPGTGACRPRRRHRPGKHELRHLGRGEDRLVGRGRACATSLQTRMVRPACPRLCA